MDMVAEAKKREGWKAVDDFWIGDSQLPNGEDGVAMSLDGHTEFIANTPAFIVAQDERIQRLQARLGAIYQAWLAIDSELDMGDHYVIKLEQYDALVGTINPTKENA